MLWLAIAILAIVTLVCVVLLILHRRKRRQEERHRERMRQEAVLRLIEQVEATDDDTVLDELYSEFLFSYEADPDRWERAKQKAAGARPRIERARADKVICRAIAGGGAGRSVEAYARELVAWRESTESLLSAAGEQMLAAECVKVANKLVELLLRQARAGHVPALIKLHDVVSHGGDPYVKSFYEVLTGGSWQPPRDWNEFVVRHVWRPDSTWFSYENVQRNPRDVRDWVAAVVSDTHRVSPQERLVQTLMLLALVDASNTYRRKHGLVGSATWVPRYREALGDALYASLVRQAQGLRPIESVGV